MGVIRPFNFFSEISKFTEKKVQIFTLGLGQVKIGFVPQKWVGWLAKNIFSTSVPF